jgi:addiction module HigA family antidote
MAKTSSKTPGVLLQEYADKNGLQLNEVAHGIGVHTQVLLQIIKGKNPIDAKLALRLAKFFGTPKTYWSDFQKKYDLKIAEDELKPDLAKIKKYVKPAKKPGRAAKAEAASAKKRPGRPAAKKADAKSGRTGRAKAADAKKPGRPGRTKAADAAAKPVRKRAPRVKKEPVVSEYPQETPQTDNGGSFTPSFE